MGFLPPGSHLSLCHFSVGRPHFGIAALALVLMTAAPALSQSPCVPGPTNPSVTVCLPKTHQYVSTPVHVQASTTDTNEIVAVQVYVDNALVYQVDAATLDAWIPLAIGSHLVTVQAWDSTGATFKTNVYGVNQTPPCALNPSNLTITICSPGDGAVVSSPVHISAGTTDSTPVTSITVSENGKLLYKTNLQNLDGYLRTLSPGAHRLTFRALDQNKASFSSALSITVTDNSGLSNIHHIFYMLQENRSFDNYFGMLGTYRVSKGLPNEVDGVPLNTVLYTRDGQPVSPYHYQTVCTDDLSPFWNQQHQQIDGGKMDGFVSSVDPNGSKIDPNGTRAMGYYDWTDIPYYYELATQFATSDRFFASVESNTISNRMYLFAATSFGHIRPDTPPPDGWPQTTLFDNLDAAGVSWRYYYQDNGSYLPQWETYLRDADKMFPISQYYTDIQNESTLPSVLFIERAGPSGLDEHPGTNIQEGAADVAGILNALLASSSWSSSAFILSYDEHGGLYDHVIPPRMTPPDSIKPMLLSGDRWGDFGHAGIRLPITVVSPWVKPNFVSHTFREITSILRFIEVTFNVPPLTARDANADDMIEFFDFSNPYWLTPPPLPVQPTNGTCDISKEKAPGY